MPKPYHTPRSERGGARADAPEAPREIAGAACTHTAGRCDRLVCDRDAAPEYPDAAAWAEVSAELRAIAAERAAALAAGLTPLQVDALHAVTVRIAERERRAAERRALRARPENRPGRRFGRRGAEAR